MTTQNSEAADWNEIAATVADALDCATEAERLTLVEARCAGRPIMRTEVLSLIGHAADAKQFIASGGAQQQADISTSKILQTLADSGAPRIGSRLNAWQILGELGRGGMGIVFHVAREIEAPTGVSAQLQTRQEGALKLMRLDASNPQALARFAREQKILAQLNHPNIARLIDGGAAPDGNPYLVMEYAAGQSLDNWCVSAQPSLQTRIAVMQKICAAVQYAHQLLIVHRDLKPSNIIIETNGNPKLLDFGIAKLLSDADSNDHTAEAARVYTPWYASPEHLRGEVVSTTSDVYSLGVILYGLLTGKRPYKLRNTTAVTAVDVMHAVLETEATRPSSANTGTEIEAAWRGDDKATAAFAVELKGDLDNIVLKAIAKEPSRRYATPEALAADLQRYLNHEPVAAASPTASYRAAKFIRRNRIGVTAAAFAASALIAGAGVAIWQGREAVKQRDIAEQRLNDSREQATTVVLDYLAGVQYLPGSTPIRKRMSEDAQKYLDKLAIDTQGDVKANAALLNVLATSLHRLSFIQYNGFNRPHLDQKEAAFANATRSLKIRDELAAAGLDSEELRFEYGQTLTQLGGMYQDKDSLELSTSYFEKCVAVYTRSVKADRPDQRNGIELARCHMRLSSQIFKVHPYLHTPAITAQYLQHLKHARDALDAVSAAQPANKEVPHATEWLLRMESHQKRVVGDWDGALKLMQTKLEIMQQLRLKEPNNSAFNTDTASTHREMVPMYINLGNFEKALEAAEAALSLSVVDVKNDPADKMTGRRHMQGLMHRAWALSCLAGKGDKDANKAASVAFTEAKEAAAALIKRDNDDVSSKAWLAETLRREAEYIAHTNPAAGLEIGQKALAISTELDARKSPTIEPTVRLAVMQNLVSTVALKAKNNNLSAAYDTQLRATLQRINDAKVAPHALLEIVTRLGKS